MPHTPPYWNLKKKKKTSVNTYEAINQSNRVVLASSPPVWCQHHRSSRLDDVEDKVPEEAASFRVHPGGGFILQDTEEDMIRDRAQLFQKISIREHSWGAPTRKIRDGYPMRAMAVDSLRLFPPLYVPAGLSAYFESWSFSKAHCTTWGGQRGECEQWNEMKRDWLGLILNWTWNSC